MSSTETIINFKADIINKTYTIRKSKERVPPPISFLYLSFNFPQLWFTTSLKSSPQPTALSSDSPINAHIKEFTDNFQKI